MANRRKTRALASRVESPTHVEAQLSIRAVSIRIEGDENAISEGTRQLCAVFAEMFNPARVRRNDGR